MSDSSNTKGFGPQPGDRKVTPLSTSQVQNVSSGGDLKQPVRKPNV